MSQRELHVALDKIARDWVASACVWGRDWLIGDYRFLVFSIGVAKRTEVYVQFWSEPFERVSWEVSSGKWNPPADKWLAGQRSERIAAFGFEVGGRAENFQREIAIASPTDAAVVGRTVVDILYAGFDYRGLNDLDVHLMYDSRAEMKPVLTSFTPEDVAKVFTAQGYSLVGDNQDEDLPVLQVRTRGVMTTVAFADRVPDQHLFQTVAFLTPDVTPPSVASTRTGLEQEEPAGQFGHATVAVSLSFSGGVTAEWLSQRVIEWTEANRQHHAGARKDKRALKRLTEAVH